MYVCSGGAVYSQCAEQNCKRMKRMYCIDAADLWSAWVVHCFSASLMQSECFVNVLTATSECPIAAIH